MVAFSQISRVNTLFAPAGAAVVGSGVAALFALMPATMLEAGVWASGIPALVAAAGPPLGTTARAVLALGGGAMAASVTWSLLYLLFGPGGLLAPRTRADAVPVVRRADAHPDAPPRRPMTAAEMGTPLMEVAPPPSPPPPALQSTPRVEQPVPANLDLPLAAFDPAAIPDVPLPPPVKVEPLARHVLAPGERIDTYVLTPPAPSIEPRRRATAESAALSIEALLQRLEERAAERFGGVPAH